MPAITAFQRSSSFVVGAVFSILLSVGILFVGYFLVVASDDTLLRESEAAVRAEMSGLIAVHAAAGPGELERVVARRVAAAENGFFYALRDEGTGAVSGSLPAWPDAETQVLDSGLLLLEVDHEFLQHPSQSVRPGSAHYDVMAAVSSLPSGGELLVGRNIDDLEIAQWVARTLGWVMIAILLSISALSFFVAYYVVSRFNRISTTMDDIVASGDLARRLPVDSSWDDMSKLSASLNRVLDELENLVGGIKSVSDNIAHDLKTPLARLRAEIEAAEIPAPVQAGLLADVDDILSVFRALLRIAEIDSGSRKRAFAEAPFAEIVEDVVDLYTPVAEDRSLTLLAQLEPVSLFCDRDLIFQAVANVVDNAIKFTPAGGEVRIDLSAGGAEVRLAIRDSGCGIPESERDKITRRFYRVEQSRTSAGNGLGLAMVAAVVKLHRGTLRFMPAAPPGEGSRDGAGGTTGTCCIMTFPVNRTPEVSGPTAAGSPSGSR